MLLRLIASPRLAPADFQHLTEAFASCASVVSAAHDSDVNCSALTLAIESDGFQPAIRMLAAGFGPALSPGRAFRIELLCTQSDAAPDDAALRSMAVELHGGFRAPVFVARRSVPMAAWVLSRPMPWGRDGLVVAQSDPALPFSESHCPGVAIEVGTPSVILKARLEDVSREQLQRACTAVSGSESGFADVGAYPAISAADGAAVAVLEFGDLKRSPIHRALAVLEIEVARHGGHIGQAALLSHLPLESLLDALRGAIGLHVQAGQVLETHLPASRHVKGQPVA